MLTAASVCVISVLRVHSLFSIDNSNPTWTLVGKANWSSLEFAIAVMCASLPTLRPLLKLFHPQSSKSRPTPQLADETIGGGRHSKSKSSRRKSGFARMHGYESDLEHGTVDMNDMETLVGRETKFSAGEISVATTVSVDRH